MPKKKKIEIMKREFVEIQLNHEYIINDYKYMFTRFNEDGNMVVKSTTSTGRWYIKMVSIEDIRTLLDIEPNVDIFIKED